MTRLPRTLRLDPSDTVIFESPAEPGEWAVPGGFAFCGKHMEAISALTALHGSLVREMIASRRATA